jgi:hypothetical protein
MQIHFSRTNEIHINSGADQYDNWGWIEQDLRELDISIISIATDGFSQEPKVPWRRTSTSLPAMGMNP